MIEWKDVALKHAKAEFPNESCGLVVVIKGRERYWPCKNLTKGFEQFYLNPDDYAKADSAGEIVAVVHSHPVSKPVPSQADLVSLETTELPWYIVQSKTGEWSDAIYPTGYKAPLIGRRWHWNVMDCWTLVRDWYHQEGLKVRDFNRPPTPEEFEANPLFESSFEAAGFHVVPKEKMKYGDGVLMALNSKKLNHVGVYIGDQMLLHHVRQRLSSRDIYGGWLQKQTGLVVRHPEFKGI